MLDLRCCDNMELMREFPDKHFDLAIVDPPYGLGMSRGEIGGNGRAKAKKYLIKDWDKIPPNEEYFKELFRVSKKQIIWGGNHFIDKIPTPNSPSWIVWDKLREPGTDYADCELAWTNTGGVAKLFRFMWNGFNQSQNTREPFLREGNHKIKEQRIHPTQKPVSLYKWQLNKYAQQGDKILDTHLGSGSIAIACHDYGFDLTACELDKDYYEAAMKRINAHVAQQKLFI